MAAESSGTLVPPHVLEEVHSGLVGHVLRTSSTSNSGGRFTSGYTNHATCGCGVEFPWSRRADAHYEHLIEVAAAIVWRAAHDT